VTAGDHAWVADEPVEVGDGLGPGPYDLLLGALGSCMIMTLLLYARRKKWALERVEVDIQHDRVYADDTVRVEEKGGLVERFQIDLVLHGDLDDAQIERLSDISMRRPVRKTLAATHVFAESVRRAN